MEDDLLLAIRLQEQFDREDRGPDLLQGPGQRGQGGPDLLQGGPDLLQGPSQRGQRGPDLLQGPGQRGQGGPDLLQGPGQRGQGGPDLLQGPSQRGQGGPDLLQGPGQRGQGGPDLLQGPGQRGQRGPDLLQEAGKRRRLEAERPLSLVDPSWEVLDPNPDVRALFLDFNQRFFWGTLSGVEVKWSPRMTLCAGVCSYEGRGGLCSIRLSEPLLKLRPRKDLVETLLHEMIHALLFVTQNNRDRDGHGPEFCKHMDRINRAGGTRITVYHSFHQEVQVYRQHWWRCDGPCRTRGPHLGWVRRAMNRPPSPLDPWWDQHRRTCGGSYTKVQEPPGYCKRGNKKKEGGSGGREGGSGGREGGNKKKEGGSRGVEGGSGGREGGNKKKEGGSGGREGGNKEETTGKESSTTGSGSQDIRGVVPFSGRGFLLGGDWSSFRTPPTPAGGRPPGKTSVGNTRAFINVNGSPVKTPRPRRGSAPPGGGRQRSLEELFGSGPAAASRGSSHFTEPPVRVGTGEPPGSSPGPSHSQFLRDSPGGAAGGGATVGGSGGVVVRGGATAGGSGGVVVRGRAMAGGSGGVVRGGATAGGSGGVVVRGGATATGSGGVVVRGGATATGSGGVVVRGGATAGGSGGVVRGGATATGSGGVVRGGATATGSGGVVRGGATATGSGGGPASRKRSWNEANISSLFHDASGTTWTDSSSSPTSSSSPLTVHCPVCRVRVQESQINQHLDSCLS